MNSEPAVLSCEHLQKTYSQGPQVVEVLRDINLQVLPGDQIAIVGSSGSGKTTLLNLLGGLDLPSAGAVHVAGKNLALVDDTQRGLLRNKYLGFVYQFHHLLGEFTAEENVAMPLLIARLDKDEAMQRAASMLARVGLAERGVHKPAELSGGERQRVAIARALVTEPRCVLLDEPTGNLDSKNGIETMKTFDKLVDEGKTIILITHDSEVAGHASRIISIRDGEIDSDTKRASSSVTEAEKL